MTYHQSTSSSTFASIGAVLAVTAEAVHACADILLLLVIEDALGVDVTIVYFDTAKHYTHTPPRYYGYDYRLNAPNLRKLLGKSAKITTPNCRLNKMCVIRKE